MRMEADLAKPRIGGTVVDAQDKWVHGHLVEGVDLRTNGARLSHSGYKLSKSKT